jgi:SAM-dependent methyltransferase
MELTEEEKKTLSYYQNNALEWSKTHLSKGFWENEYKIFHRLLTSGKIIDIGCGTGRDAGPLVKLGFDYFGVDISENIIQVAQKQNPKLQFDIASIYDLSHITDKFDGFIIQAVLVHLPKNRLKQAFNSVHSVLKPNATGWITVKAGVGEGIITDKRIGDKDNQRYWSFFDFEEFKGVLANNGFELLDSYKHYLIPEWLIYFVKAKE